MTSISESAKYLRRYTDIPSLIYMLKNQALTLLNPESWDDKNDTTYLRLYKEKAELSTILALCFSESDETYHHWKVFSPGPSGVCITFKRDSIENIPNLHKDVTFKKVRYLKLIENRAQPLKRAELLYSKRRAFMDEKEVRLIYRSKSEVMSSIDLPISLSAIEKIMLSPWLHPSLRTDLKETIKNIKGCSNLKVYRSTLVGNQEWRKLGENAA
jgi:hypothetical protein